MVEDLQALLDDEARLCNRLDELRKRIVELRGGHRPVCFGQDDCSTLMLVRCPWRIDCGPTR